MMRTMHYIQKRSWSSSSSVLEVLHEVLVGDASRRAHGCHRLHHLMPAAQYHRGGVRVPNDRPPLLLNEHVLDVGLSQRRVLLRPDWDHLYTARLPLIKLVLERHNLLLLRPVVQAHVLAGGGVEASVLGSGLDQGLDRADAGAGGKNEDRLGARDLAVDVESLAHHRAHLDSIPWRKVAQVVCGRARLRLDQQVQSCGGGAGSARNREENRFVLTCQANLHELAGLCVAFHNFLAHIESNVVHS
mmetsp:Transcript_36034/g.78621  ORF Transcript_36034/g.78621 Transcript_36034/m.78621 type:complete len:245 (+) Transcript_36034:196-930(+)